MKSQLISTLKIFIFFTLVFGLAYPLSITIIAQSFFANKANGSLVHHKGAIIGSELLAQKTTSSQYFWPRPSASNYETIPSGASNLSLTSIKLHEAIKQRALEGAAHELLFSSASGLDPHISKDAALSQISRIAEARKLDKNQQQQLIHLIDTIKENRQFGFLGEERINVLKLNLNTDTLFH